jgi:hypothetical protein
MEFNYLKESKNEMSIINTTDLLKTEKSRIIKEILDTETKYVNDLKILQDKYGDEILNSKIINEKEFKIIFSSKGLIPINEIFILEKLKKFWGNFFKYNNNKNNNN